MGSPGARKQVDRLRSAAGVHEGDPESEDREERGVTTWAHWRRIVGVVVVSGHALCPGKSRAQATSGQSGWSPIMPGLATGSQFLGAQPPSVTTVPRREELLEEADSARWK